MTPCQVCSGWPRLALKPSDWEWHQSWPDKTRRLPNDWRARRPVGRPRATAPPHPTPPHHHHHHKPPHAPLLQSQCWVSALLLLMWAASECRLTHRQLATFFLFTKHWTKWKMTDALNLLKLYCTDTLTTRSTTKTRLVTVAWTAASYLGVCLDLKNRVMVTTVEEMNTYFIKFSSSSYTSRASVTCLHPPQTSSVRVKYRVCSSVSERLI